MSDVFSLRRLSLALGVVLGLAACAVFADDDPEPASVGKEEPAVPSVDPDKTKTDQKLAKQADRNESDSQGNLKAIGAAVWQYHDDKGNVFPDDIRDKNGKPLLSWRVAILPYVEMKKLYEEFKLDEPWDSKHNKKLLAKMPKVFASPRVTLKGKGNTVYQTFNGPDAVFGRGRPVSIRDIPDGTSNTIMAVEASVGVPWTKPGGIPFARNKAIPDFGKAYGKKPLAVLMDGSTRVLDLNKIREQTLKDAIDPADGNVLGNDWQ
jgi:hypothetical protein